MTFDYEKLESRITELLQRLRITGETYAKAKTEYDTLDEATKSILAAVALTHQGALSHGQQLALASEQFRRHREALGIARDAFLKAQIAWDIAKKEIEVWQTLMSNAREELKKFRG